MSDFLRHPLRKAFSSTSKFSPSTNPSAVPGPPQTGQTTLPSSSTLLTGSCSKSDSPAANYSEKLDILKECVKAYLELMKDVLSKWEELKKYDEEKIRTVRHLSKKAVFITTVHETLFERQLKYLSALREALAKLPPSNRKLTKKVADWKQTMSSQRFPGNLDGFKHPLHYALRVIGPEYAKRTLANKCKRLDKIMFTSLSQLLRYTNDKGIKRAKQRISVEEWIDVLLPEIKRLKEDLADFSTRFTKPWRDVQNLHDAQLDSVACMSV